MNTEREQAYKKFWNDLSLKGDPFYVPNKFLTGFNAGFAAGRLSAFQKAAEIAEHCRDGTAAYIAEAIREQIAEQGGEAEQ